jgi:hypothetical protein
VRTVRDLATTITIDRRDSISAVMEIISVLLSFVDPARTPAGD